MNPYGDVVLQICAANNSLDPFHANLAICWVDFVCPLNEFLIATGLDHCVCMRLGPGRSESQSRPLETLDARRCNERGIFAKNIGHVERSGSLGGNFFRLVDMIEVRQGVVFP